MNRIIKFRAWHNKAKKMLESGSPRYVFTWKDDGQDITIMQFTGLYDKNGKEIYEGDVVKYINEYSSFPNRHIVKFEKEFARFSLFISISDDFAKEANWPELTDIEIIGNVFQNPDLLYGTPR